MAKFFITGTGTAIGKTFFTAAMCHQFGYRALKPMLSGYDFADNQNDAAVLLRAMGEADTEVNQQAIAPWRYAMPLAPPMAAARERKTLPSLDALARFCQEKSSSEKCLVEGAGGILSPLLERTTNLDFAEALGWSVILICGNYLGTISHSLSAIEVIRRRGLSLRAVIFSESDGSGGGATLAETQKAIQDFAGGEICIYSLNHQPSGTDGWRSATLPGELCHL